MKGFEVLEENGGRGFESELKDGNQAYWRKLFAASVDLSRSYFAP